MLHLLLNRLNVSKSNGIATAVVMIATWVNVGLAQDRAQLSDKNGKTPSRDGRQAVTERMQLSEGRSRLSESLVERQKSVDGGAVSEIRRAERLSDTEKAQPEDTTSASFVPLPNTMDGLNDKRPLSIGDKLSFRVVEDEGSPRALSVTDSAEIDVPYIGRVPVGNKTCKQFAYYIKRLLEKEYYYQATVIVGLDAAGVGARAASRGKCYVMGQVRSAGPQDIPLDETYTVSKAILRAGGFGQYANRKKVKVVRGGKGGANSKPIYVDCAEIFDKAHWDKDIEIGPDDIITVAEKWISFF